MLSVAPRCNREWNEQPQQGLGELERINARTTHQTVALGQILSALYERSRRGRVTSLTRLASPLLCLTICVAAQPNPTQSGSAPFPILLFMRWHFYPPIKTFKGPLSKRKECCFNSVVAPCLGPFFSVCNQLASCLMFSSQRRAKRGPSPLWDVCQHGPWALFSLPQALRADYKPLACLQLLQPHCFSLATTWFSGLRDLGEELVASMDLLSEDHKSRHLSRTTIWTSFLFAQFPRVTFKTHNLPLIIYRCLLFW